MSSGEQELQKLNDTLGRYAAVSKKTVSEVIAKKGRDLGIKIYFEFSQKKWGGPGKNKRGLATAELAARRAKGQGTAVRARLRADFEHNRAQLAKEIATPGRDKNLATKARRLRRNLWQRAVGLETKARQAGIGALAASFLLFRSRSSQARGTYFALNRTRSPLGRVIQTDDSIQLTSFALGASEVDARYGIVARAIEAVRVDTEVYLLRKETEALKRAL